MITGPVRQAAAALALFALLAIVHTWPLASAPATHSRHDNSDPMLNEWALAWIAHQLPRDPLRLFDANIFHPERHTLAYSEHLFVQGLMGAPLRWAGASTLLVHNLLLIAGFALTGWSMCLVIHKWTSDWWAGVLAGILFAFNAHSLTRLGHIQALHVEFLPVAVLALDRLLSIPRARTAVLLGVAFALQSLTSNYLMVFLTFGLVASALTRPGEWLRPARWKTFALLALAAAIAAAILVPFLVPYLEARRAVGLSRPLGEVAAYSASWRDYLSTGSRLHYEWWSEPFWRGNGAPLFPGITGLALVGIAIGTRAAFSKQGRLWIGLGAAGFVLSFGAALPGYHVLYELVPLLQGIRAAVRFGYLALVAVAALAGLGLAALRARPGAARWRTPIAAAAIVLATVEAARLPLAFTRAHVTPTAAYRVIAEDPEAGAVVELPFFAPTQVFRNGRYLLHATAHWRPMLNGYSGFTPPSYVRHYELLRSFPDPSTLAALRGEGVSHVVVHVNAFVSEAGQERFDQIATSPGLQLVMVAGNLRIYRLRRVVP
jgi:hypothetical protein